MTVLANLFVYGTLRPAASGAMGTDERGRLAEEARYLGPATTQGLLIDLGAYPGLVNGPGLVHGDLYSLTGAAGTLAWLDTYEGITGAVCDEYLRRVCPIAMPNGRIAAWVYFCRRAPIGARAIASGDWLIG